jgi:TetR/AcrR family transcriptional repressor of nem operon
MAKQSTRDLLIDVGLERMHTLGYASTGVKEILAIAGVAKGSFYHYSPSKEAFAREVLRRYFTGESKRAEKILGKNKIAPLKRLRKYFDELIAVYGPSGRVPGCMAGSLTLEMADHSDVLQSLLSESFSRWQSGIEAILRAAVERGELAKGTKTNELAAFVLNSYEGVRYCAPRPRGVKSRSIISSALLSACSLKNKFLLALKRTRSSAAFS